jgi:CBS domain-containing protein
MHAQEPDGHAEHPAGEAPPAPTALTDVVEFLRAHPPFDALPPEEVARVAGSAEVEFHREGDTILSQGSEPVHHVRIVRSGAVEVISDGLLLDLLGPGELFGHGSMLSGLPAGFTARAHEDTLTYRIAEDVAVPVLARPETVTFVARSLLAEPRPPFDEGQPGPPMAGRDPAHQPVAALLRGEPVVVTAETTIRDAARMMGDSGATAVVVRLAAGGLGIVTDRDLRSRVLAAGLSGDAPVGEVMTTPAYTVAPDRLGGGVLLEMLDRGVRHFPVISSRGEVIGVIADVDLVAVETRNSFYVRRLIAGANRLSALVAAAAHIRPMIVALHDSRIAATSISAIHSVVLDALTRRLVELTLEDLGDPGFPFALLALGSHARREAVPNSDLDSALVWYGPDDDDVRQRMHAIGTHVVGGAAACGLHPDEHGVNASDLRVVRSADSWQRVARSWMNDPTQEQALILVSVFVDSRPVWGIHAGPPVAEVFGIAPQHPVLLRLLARFALSYRPPTGFLRGLVVEHTGERRGRLDLKHGGIIPIVDLARWAAMSAGVTSTSTAERLRAARDAGTLPRADAESLLDAHELIVGLRIEHQIEQIARGEPLDDHIDPAQLSPLTRSYLKESFRAIASAQKRVAAEMQIGMR